VIPNLSNNLWIKFFAVVSFSDAFLEVDKSRLWHGREPNLAAEFRWELLKKRKHLNGMMTR
jgi:hypothetical protein